MDSSTILISSPGDHSSSDASLVASLHTTPPSTHGSASPDLHSESQNDFSAGQNDPSVIVGMACRVPGATSTSQLWKNLVEQKDLRRKMPEERFNVDAFYHPQGTNKGTVSKKIPLYDL